jgi:hypothetical protein
MKCPLKLERKSLCETLRLCAFASALTLVLLPGHADAQQKRFEFTKMVAHWAQYDGDDYLPFIEEAQPDLAQFGFYGGHFWSLAHTKSHGGYPAHLPVQGHDECGKWFEDKNRELHKRGVKVIGHFNVEFLIGDPGGERDVSGSKVPRGFFDFYRNHWDEKRFGPKPVEDPLDFIEKNADGTLIGSNSYKIGGMREYWACLRNPNWQTVLKAWVKNGVRRGLDGFIANYFYRHNCRCEHCERGFRKYLSSRFEADDLKSQFQINDLASHKFDELIFWHKPEESTPLRREMLRWSQISNKEVFDEVFVKYGRSLKPDLIVAQWNHLSNFSQISGDERCLLPGDLWGRDEDYLWYSMGASGHYSDIENRYLGEGTLQARYIRGSFDDKPFTLGKYENTRLRLAISELAANGGAPMGFYTRFTDPEARKVIAQYYQFLRRHDSLLKGNRSHAEVVLLYPRKAVHAGSLTPVELFRTLGTKLLDEHVLFDILPDDIATKEQLAKYRSVVDPNDFLKTKGGVASTGTGVDSEKLSRFEADWTVRVSASRPASNVDGEFLTLHFVNYNRDEPPKGRDGKPSAGRGVVEEKPIKVSSIAASFVLPPGRTVSQIEVSSPEKPEPVKIKYKITTGDDWRVEFTMPEFLVYGVANLKLKLVE